MIEKDPAAAAKEFKTWIADGDSISGIVSAINYSYKDEYCKLMAAGKTKEAAALGAKLQSLGLYYKNGKTNYYRQAALNDWWKDYQKKKTTTTQKKAVQVPASVGESNVSSLPAAGIRARTSTKKSEMTSQAGNVDLANRPVIDASKLVRAGWDDAGDGIATVYSSTYSAGDITKNYDWAYDKNVVINITPITSDGSVLSPFELEQYLDKIVKKGVDILWADRKENGGKGLVMSVMDVKKGQTLDQAYEEAERWTERIHEEQERYYGNGR